MNKILNWIYEHNYSVLLNIEIICWAILIGLAAYFII